MCIINFEFRAEFAIQYRNLEFRNFVVDSKLLLLFYLTSFAYGHLITGLGIKRTKVYEGEVTDLGLLSWNLLRKEDPTSVTNLVDQTRMFPLRFKTS